MRRIRREVSVPAYRAVSLGSKVWEGGCDAPDGAGRLPDGANRFRTSGGSDR